MELTDADIREFVKIWADEFHEKITEQEARVSASMLLDLSLLLCASGTEDKCCDANKE